jgi:hypothetical protein
MNQEHDHQDTVAMEDATQWAATQADDVFLPSVRVTLGWVDVESAVESGAIVPKQAHALWAGWAAPGSETRVKSEVDGEVDATVIEPAPVEAPWVPERPVLRPSARTGNSSGGGFPTWAGLLLAFVLGAVAAYAALSL